VIVYFGVGNIAQKTWAKTSYKPELLVDNAANMWGTTWNGLVVHSPSEIDLSVSSKIIICTTSYRDVIEQLSAMGIERSKLLVSPVLESVVIADRVDDICFDLLIASGLPSHAEDNRGGGIFRLKGTFEEHHLEKVYAGNCHSIARCDVVGNYFGTDSDKGIIQFDLERSGAHSIDLPRGLRVHGCVKKRNDFFVACSYADGFIKVSEQGRSISEPIRVSDQIISAGTPRHHVNDIAVDDHGFVWLSMFSLSGSWQQGFLDGGVLKIDVERNARYSVFSDLSMPHNITLNDDGFAICNSLTGEVLENNKNKVFSGNGFTRGFLMTEDYVVVGESKNRNFANVKDLNLNACLDTRINFIDKSSGAYRSVQLPPSISEIHSICAVA